MATQEPIAIIGIGCRFPGNGNTPSALWDVLREPKDLLTKIPEDRFNVDGYYHENGSFGGHANVTSSYLLEGKGFHRKFDAQFFGISPAEAHALDPQVRLLLETIYEAIEDSGHTLDQLQGSDTAVYAGVLMHDYEHIMSRDPQFMNRYHATGITQSLVANRISYCFNWNGPSMILDTACSASLYAVHLAIQQLRSGASSLAVATGCNLMLDPLPYISQSKMNMLSPTGRSRMWDEGANGYARGEGIAAVTLKPLSRAEADGDPIHAIIRETGINQDGRTPGITMPSAKAQVALIRSCYARAGLDLNKQADRPQYFEAHGTGTPAGDPIEAEAISTAMFGNSEAEKLAPLHVGSIKTVIGHTEGTAGLASLIKAVLAMKHGTIPANLLMNRLNPRVEPFTKYLRVPTSGVDWPIVPDGQPRRASVNSFGFGGANAHAILETYTPKRHQSNETTAYSPFIFSAASQACLSAYLSSFRDFLAAKGSELTMRDLAFTLHSRRSIFPYAASFSAESPDSLLSKISKKIESVNENSDEAVGVRASQTSTSRPRFLGIFTGQGAQWLQMGAELVSSSPAAKKIIGRLDSRLASLPPETRPTWSLTEELLKNKDPLRINDPAFAQTLSLAIQVLLVDVLAAAGVKFTAVVGHSSGEIGAAYAAGRLTADDAICKSYLRGLSVSSILQNSKPGAMLAVGTTEEDMRQLLDEPEFKDRAWVAAINSASSLTVSGDADAIDEIHAIMKDEKKFARRLKVNRAYHSPHIIGSSVNYAEYQNAMSEVVLPPTEVAWFSSVYGQDNSTIHDELKGSYWVENLLKPVLFKQAVEKAWNDKGPFDAAIEIGPHPILKGPTLQIVQDLTNQTVPYTALLKREQNALESLADGLGYIACHVGKGAVDFQAFESFLSHDATFRTLQGLPPYSWNHSTEYWHESRYTRAISHRSDKVHELLGHMTPDSSDREMRWRHAISPKQVPWLSGHRVQGQTVYPGAAFLVTVVEACLKLAKGQSVSLIEVLDITMGQALTFDDDETPVEVVFSLSNIEKQEESPCLSGAFSCSAAKLKSDTVLQSLAYGKFCIHLGPPSDIALPGGSSHPTSLIDVDSDDFYTSLLDLDYEFSGDFVALQGLKRKLGLSTGFLPGVNAPTMLIHPAMVDALFQSIVLAASAPYDGRMWAAHIPNHIDAIRVNPSLCEAQRESTVRPAFEGISEHQSDMSYLLGHSNMFLEGSEHAMIAVEGVKLTALSRATAENDQVRFSSTPIGLASPDMSKIDIGNQSVPGLYEFKQLLQRVASCYLRKLEQDVPSDHSSRVDSPYSPIFHYASQTVKSFRDGHLSLWNPEWDSDTPETVEKLLVGGLSTPDSRLLQAIGPRLGDIVMGNASPIDIGMQDELLAKYYEGAFGMSESLGRAAKTVGQILHRYPRIRCLEIGAGTGTATKAILQETGSAFSEYTFTDISSGFFPSAQANLGSHADGMVFKPLDIGKDPNSQGFEPHSYDVIIASLVLHATPLVTETLKNVRRLLKPGGYLIAIEIQKNIPAHIGAIFGAFSGWWLGGDDGRVLSPCIDIPEWNDILCETGFSGCDSSAFEADPMVHPATVFVSQAVDDRVAFLRNPLANQQSPSNMISKLLLLGGARDENAKLVAQLTSLLGPFCTSVTHCRQLTDIDVHDLDSKTFVLSLLDVDKPFFQDLTDSAWESMKTLLQQVGSLVWVTQGRSGKEPHSHMMIGLMRSILNELPNITPQFVDFEDETQLDGHSLGASVLQLAYATRLRHDDKLADMLYTIEPELIFQEAGTLVLPRMKTEQAMNDRYNASRRVFSAKIPAATASVGLGPVKPGYYVRQDRVLENATEVEGPSVRVLQSLLTPLRLNKHTTLFWLIGERTDTRELVLALSLLNEAIVRPELILPLPALGDRPTAGFLRLVCLYQISLFVFQDSEERDRVLIHDADPAFKTFLEAEGMRKGIEVICTTTHESISGDPLKLHPNAPEKSIQALKPESITAFIDFGVLGESPRVSQRISRQLNVSCKRETIQTIFGGFTRNLLEKEAEKIRATLQDAIDFAVASQINIAEEDANVIGLADIDTINNDVAYRYILDWTKATEVPGFIEPVDTQPLFPQDKSYWLAGLTGTLGLSLCEWMVRNGARYIAISSRSPNVDPRWLDMMTSRGATIKVNSCDITNLQDVQKTYEDLCSSMPPVAGVAQGAMVLHDIGLSSMSLEHLQKVLRPKVEGSINLDKIFHSTKLDFFIFFSSVSSVVGSPGQAAYGAANLFMTGLAEQRRRRGLPSAAINIGPVVGAGYITRRSPDIKPLLLLGLRPISERDFHLLFAEAVVACQSKSWSSRPVDITMGIKQIRENDDVQPRWATNPIMGHWVLNSGTADVVANKSKVPLKEQLLEARSEEEISALVKGAILNKLVALLGLDLDLNNFDDTIGMDELGVDSLMATEVRLLLMNAFRTNVPVLRIMSGITFKELVAIVVEDLDPLMVPNARAKQLTNGHTPAPSNPNPSEQPEKPLVNGHR